MYDDWRLLKGQIEYLNDTALIYHKYKPKNKTNDHDHCEFCMRKFGYEPPDLNVGYSTLDNDIWICENCYKDFFNMFNWNVTREEK